ncbi:endonuclease III domain-containing protein [Chlamydiota bacterium]
MAITYPFRNPLDLKKIYDTLFTTFGPQKWWPGDSPEEIIIGAILTQNTSWKNVEKAILNLKEHDLIDFKKLSQISESTLSPLLIPAGYYNLKTKRLKNFITWINTQYNNDLAGLRAQSTEQIRSQLLSVNGIGNETADSIILYALNKPIFVIDAYTKRILLQHGFINENATYKDMQELFHTCFNYELDIFNEFHALIVHIGKHYCKKSPQCYLCPLHHDLNVYNSTHNTNNPDNL